MSQSVTFKINSPKVVQETIDGEVVIVNLDKGDYYSLVKSAADVWSGIERGISSAEILEEMVQKYEGSRDEIETAVSEMIQKLQEEEIIVVAEGEITPQTNGESKTNGNTEKQIFEPPVLQKYTDMEELLALDPIHEVDEMGWPNAKVEA
ncbi:MAG TPA: pyrroloquinoline quinone biosynthesis protein PqqD [Cyanobacteria bacterium UBA11149]|nr:pyrroloquinoline quinone biosynthesis protein PqqD [Cyanobacteria bacterium UBA11367]HBE58221.1 pyrroloquinoline quinone biosynthesis protein PqqD [Cyanobacteria bacterium UBA11366]HBK66920.1 pyrroloquinoline quinone biosynthesis protein PqqD [Cyanobacteria bacterium UBA11166]HBR76171.1 pyrroloquinoline quinone biosynthesis protein PqqD [Cyanobacteria bacterium UBA11159]HBS70746.1 pyrroloquinoline quinone biosynthesis protein PqqD [Cyanobacteria bacterium UBA11153]HBW88562.1 pyrroloquinolin